MSKQKHLTGMEPPEHNEDIERSLDAWLDAKDEQKSAADTAKLRHATLLLHMETAGLQSYPYLDRSSGKKKRVKIKREPKIVTGSEPRHGRRDDVEIADEVDVAEAKLEKEQRKADVVESRRIARTAEHDQAADPFAATRGKMH